MHGYVSKSDFARIYGCSKPYVSELVKTKRLVLSEDGRLVNVEASLRLLNVTADPSKAGVRERWDAYRSGGKAADAPAPAPAAPRAAAPVAEPPAAPAQRSDDGSAYHQARTKREEAEAALAVLELRKALGQLLDADATLRAITDIETAARVEVMGLADRLTPLVAPETDVRKVYDLIVAECERLCATRAKRFAAMAEAAEAAVNAAA